MIVLTISRSNMLREAESDLLRFRDVAVVNSRGSSPQSAEVKGMLIDVCDVTIGMEQEASVFAHEREATSSHG